ncbi:MAG: hypothetical protein ACLU9S_06640 [Oscillospiraceae bacterium]
MAELTRINPEKYVPCPSARVRGYEPGPHRLRPAKRPAGGGRWTGGIWQGPVATVLTQVEVDPDDPAFRHPTKPHRGPSMTRQEAERMVAVRGCAAAGGRRPGLPPGGGLPRPQVHRGAGSPSGPWRRPAWWWWPGGGGGILLCRAEDGTPSRARPPSSTRISPPAAPGRVRWTPTA